MKFPFRDFWGRLIVKFGEYTQVFNRGILQESKISEGVLRKRSVNNTKTEDDAISEVDDYCLKVSRRFIKNRKNLLMKK
jgi:hypothetical protein